MNINSWKKLSSPVLQTADLSGQSGPGHNCFVRDEKGNLLIVYHARPSSHSDQKCGTYNKDPLYDPCRHTRIKRVAFDGSGDPVINLSDEAELAPQNKNITVKINYINKRYFNCEQDFEDCNVFLEENPIDWKGLINIYNFQN